MNHLKTFEGFDDFKSSVKDISKTFGEIGSDMGSDISKGIKSTYKYASSKVLNIGLINKIKDLQNADNNTIIDFLESILDKTRCPQVAKLDLLRQEMGKGDRRANQLPKSLLNQLKIALSNKPLSDITIQGPNNSMRGWVIDDTPYGMCFHT